MSTLVIVATAVYARCAHYCGPRCCCVRAGCHGVALRGWQAAAKRAERAALAVDCVGLPAPGGFQHEVRNALFWDARAAAGESYAQRVARAVAAAGEQRAQRDARVAAVLPGVERAAPQVYFAAAEVEAVAFPYKADSGLAAGMAAHQSAHCDLPPALKRFAHWAERHALAAAEEAESLSAELVAGAAVEPTPRAAEAAYCCVPRNLPDDQNADRVEPAQVEQVGLAGLLQHLERWSQRPDA